MTAINSTCLVPIKSVIISNPSSATLGTKNDCHSLIPIKNWTSHSSLHAGGMGDRMGRVKERELVVWDKKQLHSKSKTCVRGRQSKRLFHQFLWAGKKLIHHFPSRGTAQPHNTLVPWEDKHFRCKYPHFFLWERLIHWAWFSPAWGALVVTQGQCPSCVPSQPHGHPQAPHHWVGWGAGKPLALCEPCLAIRKTSLC